MQMTSNNPHANFSTTLHELNQGSVIHMEKTKKKKKKKTTVLKIPNQLIKPALVSHLPQQQDVGASLPKPPSMIHVD
jgi:alcohol dehydrogenase YqhD (iron-dependent ADH family)